MRLLLLLELISISLQFNKLTSPDLTLTFLASPLIVKSPDETSTSLQDPSMIIFNFKKTAKAIFTNKKSQRS